MGIAARHRNCLVPHQFLHGAEIDCHLLADVYIELLGGRQPGLDFGMAGRDAAEEEFGAPLQREPRPPRVHAPSIEELAAHQAMLDLGLAEIDEHGLPIRDELHLELSLK